MKQIYTSYFANIKKLSPDMNPVGISVGKNRWVSGVPYDQRLAPTWAMLKMERADYDKQMANILSKLDAQQVYNELPENAVLICYEKYNDWCHRRMVAEWLENELGIVVPEYGLAREESFDYKDLSEATKGKKRKVEKEIKKEPVAEQNVPEAVQKRKESYEEPSQLSLFDF